MSVSKLHFKLYFWPNMGGFKLNPKVEVQNKKILQFKSSEIYPEI